MGAAKKSGMLTGVIAASIFASLMAAIFFLRWYLDVQRRQELAAQFVSQSAPPPEPETLALDCLGFIGGTDVIRCQGVDSGDVWVAEWTELPARPRYDCPTGRGRLHYYKDSQQEYRSEERQIPGCGVLGRVRFQKIMRP